MVELHIEVNCDWIRELDICHGLLGLLLNGLLLVGVEFLAACLVDGPLVAGGGVDWRLKNIEVLPMMRADILHIGAVSPDPCSLGIAFIEGIALVEFIAEVVDVQGDLAPCMLNVVHSAH